MEADVLSRTLWWAFALGAVFGVVANKTNYCSMGAVSDLVNIGDTGRLRAWMLAVALALAGVVLFESSGIIDMSLTADNETSNPPYRMPMFVWPRYLLGGLLFGVGMTLASGCGNKTLIRLGAGNLKSIVVLACIGAGAWLMLYTDFFYLAFLQWMQPLAVDLGAAGIDSQDLGAIARAVTGTGAAETWRMLIGGVLAVVLGVWAFKSRDLRASADNVLAGVVVGGLVVAGWYLTAGPMGQLLLEEIDFMDQRPYAAGAQSLTFIAPTGHTIQFLAQGLPWNLFTFAMAVIGGVAVGSLAFAIVARQFRIEWFRSLGDFVRHVVGGLMMGIGGVMGLGCTIGQGISGVATLAVGSFLTTGAIVFGAALTMKYMYYRMLHEDASAGAALMTALADLRLLPARLRKLEAL